MYPKQNFAAGESDTSHTNKSHTNVRINYESTINIVALASGGHSYILTIIHLTPSHSYYLIPSTAESTRQERDSSRQRTQAK